MKGVASRVLPTILTSLVLAATVQAGTLSGTVINRTTGMPEPNVDLDLLSPTAGMAELATAKSDAQGHFSVTKDSIGMGPILIRATFHDVSFNTFAPPGRADIQVEIYNISKDPKTITVSSHVVIFQPEGSKLVGAEEYSVENASQPAYAFFRSDGNFDFAIPENATLGQVSTTTSTGMSVAQASIDRGKDRFAIAYPFRPGQTNVRLSYELPYPNNAATLKLPSVYPGAKMLVVVPPGVTVTGDGLIAAGQEQGMLVYTHDPLPAKGMLSLSLSGVGSPQSVGDSQGTRQEGNSRQGPEVIAAPSRLDELKWILLVGLAALFAMGAILLSRKQVVLSSADDENAAASHTKAAKPALAPKPKKALSVSPPPSAPDTTAEVDKHVSANMDSLKDQMFRLELRHQAGTISEAEYAREKAQIAKLLRDLVQG